MWTMGNLRCYSSSTPQFHLIKGLKMTHVTSATVQISGPDLRFIEATLGDSTPTGAQIARAFGLPANESVTVLRVAPGAGLSEVPLHDPITLATDERFIAAVTDRLFFFMVDDMKFPWPASTISGQAVRLVAALPLAHELYLERREEADLRIEHDTVLDLDRPGIEKLYTTHTAPRTWQLEVQGKTIESATPTIMVKEALEKAGFSTTQGWYIFLKVQNQPKVPLELTSIIDLTQPGIEKLRLTPRAIENGETAQLPTREFSLLDADEAFLDKLDPTWATVTVPEPNSVRRWLVLHDYRVVPGYNAATVTLALEIPGTYPAAQIDMFYVYPPLKLATGAEIPSTQVRAVIGGVEFHGWSRHRGAASLWDPNSDNVITHLALVEAALLKEVGQ